MTSSYFCGVALSVLPQHFFHPKTLITLIKIPKLNVRRNVTIVDTVTSVAYFFNNSRSSQEN